MTYLAQLEECPNEALIDVRGAEGFRAACSVAIGAELPQKVNRACVFDQGVVYCVGADRWLVRTQQDHLVSLNEQLCALARDYQGVITMVGDAYCHFSVGGPAARAILAQGTPLDLRQDTIQVGDCAATMLARVAVIIYLADALPTYLIHLPRSYREYMLEWFRAVM